MSAESSYMETTLIAQVLDQPSTKRLPIGSVFFSRKALTPKKQVLIVEDENEIANMASIFLGGAGFRSYVASNVSDAEEELVHFRPDAVLLDINLPDESGFAFLHRFKDMYPDVPVIMYTSEGYSEEKMTIALKNGASAYVSKLVGFDNVILTLRQLLNA